MSKKEPKNWHKVEQINEDTWRIIEGDIMNCYLLLGRERALLIDTGNGMGNIGQVVGEITDLPVTIALTHRHCDHAGGRGWFSSPAYVHDADMTPLMSLLSGRIAAKAISYRWTKQSDFLKQPYDAGYTALTDGAVFELGGRAVSVVHLPGHTAGSVAFLDDKHRMMFAGDNISEKGLWMFLPGNLSLEEWAVTCERILKLSEKYTPYSGHGAGEMTTAMIEHRLNGVKELLKKQKRNRLLSGKKTLSDENGTPLIVYNPANVFKKKSRRKGN